MNYDIKTIWNNNDVLPSQLKNAVLKLYASPKYADRFLAALATFSITSGSSVTDKLDQKEFLEVSSVTII